MAHTSKPIESNNVAVQYAKVEEYAVGRTPHDLSHVVLMVKLRGNTQMVALDFGLFGVEQMVANVQAKLKEAAS